MDIIQDSELTQSATRLPEPEQTHTAMNLLLLGAGSGVLLHWLVWSRIGGGLGMLMWTVLSCAAVLWLNRHQSVSWRRELLCWTIVMCSAATLAVLRDALAVLAFMYLVMVFCLGVVFYRARGHSLGEATIPSVVLTALRLPARILLSLFPALDTVIRSRWQGGGQLGGVFRGLLLATPLLFVFVLLFASADAVFSRQLDRIGQFMGEMTPSTPLITLLMIVVATGLLSCSLLQKPDGDSGRSANQRTSLWPGLSLTLGRTETAIVMGSLTLLFLTFVLLQASYLFGGRELIETRSGLTLADYARRGFFELLTVAGLTLGVLMAIASTQCHQPLFRRSGAVMIACVMVMLLSALTRLNLYIEQFGLTLARLMALALMAWLAGGLLWFAATVLRGSARGFLAGLVISGMACGLILAAINPLARVAEVNVSHAQTSGTPLDIEYLARLGADAVPVIVPTLSCARALFYFGRWADLQGGDRRLPVPSAKIDWRDWNASRMAAHQAVINKLESCGPAADL
ncbi:MAG: DUF4173 domain-containing protein [Pseudohongiella sp.]|nr:DUF4173 domain-containing protein [Pseudohongiella sp.]MDO9520230.1 DUF4173 domain-containing protein [Pseudohongiella sp.]